MCYSLNQGVFHHMKRIRGIMVVLAVLMVLAMATVARADGGATTQSDCQNIVWCKY